jgi:hypothetical protein
MEQGLHSFSAGCPTEKERHTMDPKVAWTVIIIVAFAVMLGLWLIIDNRRRRRLRERFGPEYGRTVHELGDVRRAEATLEARAKRVERLKIQHLSAADAAQFTEAWRQVQTRFVDTPEAAVTQADRLVGEVMTARGYPLGDFDQRAADISVDHPEVVSHYRAARDIARRQGRSEATTEDLRQAVVHYRALFEDLLDLKGQQRANPLAQHDRELVRGRE